jgi:hypothetical protein
MKKPVAYGDAELHEKSINNFPDRPNYLPGRNASPNHQFPRRELGIQPGER